MSTASQTISNSVIDNSSSTTQHNTESGMSKRQMKRIRRKEKWLERKGEKRVLERQKAKEKRAHARANNIDLGPSRKALKKCTMATSDCRVAVTIDMSFDDLMLDKDIAKLTKQILRCYTLNRRAVSPVQFSLTAFDGKSKQEMQKHNGYQHWDVKFFADSYLRVYQGRRIVYLTSESENVIYTLRSDCVYVIGGLVDHNSHKGHCYKLAVQQGIGHARLPLDTLMQMKARKVLTVDHVFEILLRVIEGKTWQQAFMQVLPVRKKAEPVPATKTSEPREESPDANYATTSTSDEIKVAADTLETNELSSESVPVCASIGDEAKVAADESSRNEFPSGPVSVCSTTSNSNAVKVTTDIMEVNASPSESVTVYATACEIDETKPTEETTTTTVRTKCQSDSECTIKNIDEAKSAGETKEGETLRTESNSKYAVLSNNDEQRINDEMMKEKRFEESEAS